MVRTSPRFAERFHATVKVGRTTLGGGAKVSRARATTININLRHNDLQADDCDRIDVLVKGWNSDALDHNADENDTLVKVVALLSDGSRVNLGTDRGSVAQEETSFQPIMLSCSQSVAEREVANRVREAARADDRRTTRSRPSSTHSAL